MGDAIDQLQLRVRWSLLEAEEADHPVDVDRQERPGLVYQR
jgi:hypothetical protein